MPTRFLWSRLGLPLLWRGDFLSGWRRRWLSQSSRFLCVPENSENLDLWRPHASLLGSDSWTKINLHLSSSSAEFLKKLLSIKYYFLSLTTQYFINTGTSTSAILSDCSKAARLINILNLLTQFPTWSWETSNLAQLRKLINFEAKFKLAFCLSRNSQATKTKRLKKERSHVSSC